jgi:hypothetical protein
MSILQRYHSKDAKTYRDSPYGMVQHDYSVVTQQSRWETADDFHQLAETNAFWSLNFFWVWFIGVYLLFGVCCPNLSRFFKLVEFVLSFCIAFIYSPKETAEVIARWCIRTDLWIYGAISLGFSIGMLYCLAQMQSDRNSMRAVLGEDYVGEQWGFGQIISLFLWTQVLWGVGKWFYFSAKRTKPQRKCCLSLDYILNSSLR